MNSLFLFLCVLSVNVQPAPHKDSIVMEVQTSPTFYGHSVDFHVFTTDGVYEFFLPPEQCTEQLWNQLAASVGNPFSDNFGGGKE